MHPKQDRGGLPELLTFEQINSILSFNQVLGSNYTGKWLETGVWVSPLGSSAITPDVPYAKVLRITLLNTSGASPPTIDTLAATFLPPPPRCNPASISCKLSVGHTGIRNVPPVCTPASSTSPTLSRDFGPSAVFVVGLSARGDVNCPEAGCDAIYHNGDVLDIEFSEDVTMCMGNCACANATNYSSYCFRPLDAVVAQSHLELSYTWSDSLGVAYQGSWVSRRTLRVTINNSTGATPPELYALLVNVTFAAGIRNYPPTSGRSVLASNALCQTKRDLLDVDCGFGKPDIFIIRVIASASRGKEEPDTIGLLSVGDTITLIFNQPTSLGNPMLCLGGQNHGKACQNEKPSPPGHIRTSTVDTCQDTLYSRILKQRIYLETGGMCKSTPMVLRQTLPKVTVDALFVFSTEISQNYEGTWIARDKFAIVITEAFPIVREQAGVIGLDSPLPDRVHPAIGCAACVNAEAFVAHVRLEAAISNVPLACLAQATTSPPLEGDFGGSLVEIDFVIADDPGNKNNFYSPGDTITVVFSKPTNMAGLPATNIPKTQIDALMVFSEPLGADYVGNWRCGAAMRNLCRDYETTVDASGKEVDVCWST